MADIVWRMSPDTYGEYLECCEALARLSPDYDYEEYQQVSERFRMLPGFPVNYDPVYDCIVPELPPSPVPYVVLNVQE